MDFTKKRRFSWDSQDRLRSVSVYDPRTGLQDDLYMTYDYRGRLIRKDHYIDASWKVETLFYHYDGDRLIAEEDERGVLREYLYGGGEAPLAMRTRNQDGTYSNYFFLTNTHGDVVALVDSSGNIVNRYHYGPWGEAERVSETIYQPFRYAGYFYEPTTDLYWLRARWYDPGTGRFLSRDPSRGTPRVIASLNRYQYAQAKPATAIDPWGLGPRRPRQWIPLATGVDIAAARAVCSDTKWGKGDIMWFLSVVTTGVFDPYGLSIPDFAENINQLNSPGGHRYGMVEWGPDGLWSSKPVGIRVSARVPDEGNWCGLWVRGVGGPPSFLYVVFVELAHVYWFYEDAPSRQDWWPGTNMRVRSMPLAEALAEEWMLDLARLITGQITEWQLLEYYQWYNEWNRAR